MGVRWCRRPVHRRAGLVPTNSTADPNLGGGFEGDPDEPYVAIYPGPASSLSHFYQLVDGLA